MKAKEFKAALEAGKTCFKDIGEAANLAFTKHPKGTYVYMDVINGIYVTVDTVQVETNNEILGWAEGVPVLTIKTEAWFA